MKRRITALHAYSDWAVRPRPTVVTFADRTQLVIFDSFKPACGYSIFWLAILVPSLPGTWWHVDVREVLPTHVFEAGAMPIEAEPKLQAMQQLLTAKFTGAKQLLDVAQPLALVANADNNELLRKRGA